MIFPATGALSCRRFTWSFSSMPTSRWATSIDVFEQRLPALVLCRFSSCSSGIPPSAWDCTTPARCWNGWSSAIRNFRPASRSRGARTGGNGRRRLYEPILISIPPQDQAEQIRRMRDYFSEHFGARRRGVAGRARVGAAASFVSRVGRGGIHARGRQSFSGAGFECEQLYGYYIAEDRGQTVKLFPA